MPLVDVNWLRVPKIDPGVTIGWPTTVASIPVGWSRVTALDARFVKQIATSSTAPGATGGASTHTHPFSAHPHSYGAHTHTGSWGTSASQGGQFDGDPRGIPGQQHSQSHGHTSTGAASASLGATSNNSTPTDTDTQVSDPLHVTIVFLSSDGSPTGVPVNGLAWYNGAAPTGWSVYSSLDNRLMKGAAGGADGGTQAGLTTHTHTSATHTHPLGGSHTHTVSLDGGNGGGNGNSSGVNCVLASHGHTLGDDPGTSNPANSDAQSETTGNGDHDPAWQKMRAIQKTGAVGTSVGMICMWSGTLANIPGRWLLCDGTSSTPNLCQGKFVRAAATDGEVGNTGGAATHTHAASAGHSHASVATHTHSLTALSGTQSNNDSVGAPAPPNATGFVGGHNHTSTTYTSGAIGIGTSTTVATTQVVSASIDPVYTGVAYIQFKG